MNRWENMQKGHISESVNESLLGLLVGGGRAPWSSFAKESCIDVGPVQGVLCSKLIERGGPGLLVVDSSDAVQGVLRKPGLTVVGKSVT